MTEGINNVILQGEICWPELKYTGTGKALFKSKLKIPAVDERNDVDRDSYLMRITAWEEFAEALNALPPRSKVRVSGRIQERSFNTREGTRRNITDIVVDGMETTNNETGENIFVLQGELVWPELRQVGDRDTNLFKAKLKIPFYREDDPENLRYTYVKITAWNELAEELSALGEGRFIKVSGHMQDRPYTSPEGEKRIFTDAIVNTWVEA